MKTLERLMAAALSAFSVYLAGCFAEAGFDIREWDAVVRGFVGSMMLFIAISTVVMLAAFDDLSK